jgi:predicted phosphodiesterase
MRVAALYDVEGNLPALDAVLSDVDRERPDAIVVGGDMVTGPMPSETLTRLRGLRRAYFLRGNADRWVVEVKRGERPEGLPDDVVDALAWTAEQLSDEQIAFLAGLPQTVTVDVDGLGQVCFCHATPRDDNELFTERTPNDAVAELLAGTTEATVVCGHTHMQFDREVDGIRVVNAGSVGLAYGAPGAHWLALGPGIEHRRTRYDNEAFADHVKTLEWPIAARFAEENIRQVPTEQEALEFFEKVASEQWSERYPGRS